ncbi:hypothetical protein S245_025029, partial [Arachis hypogaea]
NPSFPTTAARAAAVRRAQALPLSSGRSCFFFLQESQLLPRARRVSPWYSSAPSRPQAPSSSSSRRARSPQPTNCSFLLELGVFESTLRLLSRRFFQPPSSESCLSPGLCLRRASAPLLRRKTLLHSNFLPSSSESRSSTKKKTLDFEECGVADNNKASNQNNIIVSCNVNNNSDSKM